MSEKKVTLLVVDDEKEICKYEKAIFERRNFKVQTAQTGSKALALAKTTKPDMALIDIHMQKGLSGLEILEKLLKINPACRCIMVTWDEQNALKAKKIGATDYVIKPTRLENLEKAINKVAKLVSKG